MASLNFIRTDPDRSESGIWVDFDQGIRLRIARLGNTKYESFLREKQAETLVTRGRRRRQKLDLDQGSDILKEAVARFVLVDWQNIDDGDGKPIPYSWEKALEFFKDPSLDEFYKFVIDTSTTVDLYLREDVADAVTKSQ